MPSKKTGRSRSRPKRYDDATALKTMAELVFGKAYSVNRAAGAAAGALAQRQQSPQAAVQRLRRAFKEQRARIEDEWRAMRERARAEALAAERAARQRAIAEAQASFVKRCAEEEREKENQLRIFADIWKIPIEEPLIERLRRVLGDDGLKDLQRWAEEDAKDAAKRRQLAADAGFPVGPDLRPKPAMKAPDLRPKPAMKAPDLRPTRPSKKAK